MRFLRNACLGLCLLLAQPAFVSAQQSTDLGQSDILVIDPERLFEGTQLGQAMLNEFRGKRDALTARNEQLAAELEVEEQGLTAARETMPAAEFRELADAFDDKVQGIRRDSELRGLELERERERLPLVFLRQVEPVILSLMREAGGKVMLDQRNVVFRTGAVDVTDAAIARINATLGTGIGTTVPESPEQE